MFQDGHAKVRRQGILLEDQYCEEKSHIIARSAPLFHCPEISRFPAEGKSINVGRSRCARTLLSKLSSSLTHIMFVYQISALATFLDILVTGAPLPAHHCGHWGVWLNGSQSHGRAWELFGSSQLAPLEVSDCLPARIKTCFQMKKPCECMYLCNRTTLPVPNGSSEQESGASPRPQSQTLQMRYCQSLSIQCQCLLFYTLTPCSK